MRRTRWGSHQRQPTFVARHLAEETSCIMRIESVSVGTPCGRNDVVTLHRRRGNCSIEPDRDLRFARRSRIRSREVEVATEIPKYCMRRHRRRERARLRAFRKLSCGRWRVRSKIERLMGTCDNGNWLRRRWPILLRRMTGTLPTIYQILDLRIDLFRAGRSG